MNKIKDLISEKNWNVLVSDYLVKDVCSSLNFNEIMNVIKHLFYDDIQDDENQQYALKLTFEVKDIFEKEWEQDWKNDVFLGELCEMLWLYDERYLCYKRAYDKLEDPPAELLLLLSCCNSTPGSPPITDEESEFYLKKAIQKELTCETALAMRGFYRIRKNKFQEDNWNEMYKKLEKENIHSRSLIPDVFKES